MGLAQPVVSVRLVAWSSRALGGATFSQSPIPSQPKRTRNIPELRSKRNLVSVFIRQPFDIFSRCACEVPPVAPSVELPALPRLLRVLLLVQRARFAHLLSATPSIGVQ